jgi:hypothetical protein
MAQNEAGTNDPIGIGREQCGDCRNQHRAHAENEDRPHADQPVVAADPAHTRVYHPDGSVDVFDSNGDYIGTAPPGAPPTATLNNYEGIPW